MVIVLDVCTLRGQLCGHVLKLDGGAIAWGSRRWRLLLHLLMWPSVGASATHDRIREAKWLN